MSVIKLIVGLGNPGAKYQQTRHNAGFWYLDALTRHLGVLVRPHNSYKGLVAKTDWKGQRLHLLMPTTFMNLSGDATSRLANFFNIAPNEMLVAHDDLDIPPGQIRLKQGGGHGGHNGLRDIISKQGNSREFLRLRIGIGHPGNSQQVLPWVLGKPSPDDRILVDNAIEQAIDHTDDILSGNINRAMTELNGIKPV